MKKNCFAVLAGDGTCGLVRAGQVLRPSLSLNVLMSIRRLRDLVSVGDCANPTPTPKDKDELCWLCVTL